MALSRMIRLGLLAHGNPRENFHLSKSSVRTMKVTVIVKKGSMMISLLVQPTELKSLVLTKLCKDRRLWLDKTTPLHHRGLLSRQPIQTVANYQLLVPRGLHQHTIRPLAPLLKASVVIAKVPTSFLPNTLACCPLETIPPHHRPSPPRQARLKDLPTSTPQQASTAA